MTDKDFRFFSDDSSKKTEAFAKVPIEKLLTETRRADDALITALSLVLSANSDYAKSLSVLLENGTNNDAVLENLEDHAAELLALTNRLIQSQEALVNILNDHKEELDALIVKLNKDQQEYMDKKFSAMFVRLGLKNDGTEHAPTDKIVVTIKKLLTKEIYLLIAGAILWHLFTLLGKKYGG